MNIPQIPLPSKDAFTLVLLAIIATGWFIDSKHSSLKRIFLATHILLTIGALVALLITLYGHIGMISLTPATIIRGVIAASGITLLIGSGIFLITARHPRKSQSWFHIGAFAIVAISLADIFHYLKTISG